MPSLPRPWNLSRVAAWAIAPLALCAVPDAVGRSLDPWMACQDRVVAELAAEGLRDFGSVGAYTGASGAGAEAAVVARCGYHPERVDRALCDDLYEQVYAVCREDGFEGMSEAAASWVRMFAPASPLVARLRGVCAQADPVDAAAFGRLVCAD